MTEEEKQAILTKYIQEDRLKTFPLKEKHRLIVAGEMTKRFQPDERYSEKEINQQLKEVYSDYVLLRRYLIENGFLDRKTDGSEYWLKK